MAQKKKTVLFFPLNAPGHINSLLGIADKLKSDFDVRTVFLILGDMMGTSVQDHGHEIITLVEKEIYEDYEVAPEEDLMGQEIDEETRKKLGQTKKKFSGAKKWPQILLRYQKIFRQKAEALADCMRLMEKFMLGELKDNHESYANAIKSVAPDLVIIDSYYIPPCVVKLKHIPWVRLFSANPLTIVQSKLPGGLKPPPMTGYDIFTKEKRQKLAVENPEKLQALYDEWRDGLMTVMKVAEGVGTALNEFLQEHNCEPPPPGAQSHESPHLNLYLYPAALDYDQDDDIFEYSSRWFRCDSLVRKALDTSKSASLKAWEDKVAKGMEGKKALVYFSLGSIASANIKLMKRLLDMLKDDTERLYVVSKGANGDKYELNSSNMIGGNYIPQTFILERANLAIIHGGNNSVTECLYYGLPTIVLPVFADQKDNAHRVSELCFGKSIDPYECKKEDLNNAINEVLADKQLIEKCGQVGKQMRSRDDARKISALLKKLLEEGHLEESFIEECRYKDYKELKL